MGTLDIGIRLAHVLMCYAGLTVRPPSHNLEDEGYIITVPVYFPEQEKHKSEHFLET